MSVRSMGFRPSAPLAGAVPVPRSKSLAQRVLVCAALCGEVTRVALGPESCAGDDEQRARKLIRRVGARIRSLDGMEHVLVRGLAPGPETGWHAVAPLDVGESGTLARLSTAAVGLCARPGQRIAVQATDSLLARKSPALFQCLERAGVRCEFGGVENGWPAILSPVAAPERIALALPASSQEVSALLIAAAAWPRPIEITVRGVIPSRAYLEMTLGVLARFGVVVLRGEAGGAETFRTHGPLHSPSGDFAIEPDASAAAVALGAACLTGGELSVAGLRRDSLQGDVRIAEHLAAFGCRVGFDGRGVFAGGEVRHGAELDLRGEPDLAPVIAAVAACAALRHGASSELRGLGTLQGKESPRIEVLAAGLSALGLRVSMTDASLAIAAGHATSGPLLLDPRGDHRMAFAFALLGLVRDGVDVLEPECVGKSWPGFWEEMACSGVGLVGGGG